MVAAIVGGEVAIGLVANAGDAVPFPGMLPGLPGTSPGGLGGLLAGEGACNAVTKLKVAVVGVMSGSSSSSSKSSISEPAVGLKVLLPLPLPFPLS